MKGARQRGTSPTSVAVGDFNGDGKLDLAVANYRSNNVSILLGNGNNGPREYLNWKRVAKIEATKRPSGVADIP
jgi:hypothetical protein